MDYLDGASNKNMNVSQADIVKGTGLGKSQVSRAFSDPDFNNSLAKAGYAKEVRGYGKKTIIHL